MILNQSSYAYNLITIQVLEFKLYFLLERSLIFMI